MPAALRALLVALHLAAIAWPCPAPAFERAAPDRAPVLAALCPCGCADAPPAARTPAPAAALLPAVAVPALPRAGFASAPEPRATSAQPRLPEPVPRPA